MTKREKMTLSASYTEMTELVHPNDANILGRALGGVVLHWMDICAAIAAMRFSGHQCVTASMDHTDFLSPIQIGEVATITAYTFETGTTSLDVMVEVQAGDPRTNERRTTTTSFFTFVALDNAGNPTPVPELICETTTEEQQRNQALETRTQSV